MDPVRFRDCACPNTPHPDGDTVTFRERLPFDANVRALGAILRDPDHASSAAWKVYLFDGPLAWNLLDEDGKPVPLDRDVLEALEFPDQYEIADRGDTIYGSQVLSPLVRATKKSSPASSTTARSRRRPTS